jgi:hypothetical protein
VSHSNRMTGSTRTIAIARSAAILVVTAVVVATACTGDDDGAAPPVSDADSTGTAPTTTSARDTPFCAGMIDLADRLEDADADDDTAAMIRTAYADLAELVPAEIAADFEAVRALLVDIGGSAVPTTVAPVETGDVTDATAAEGDGEGAALGDTPTERLADYVDLTCRSTANNPGPAATQPP